MTWEPRMRVAFETVIEIISTPIIIQLGGRDHLLTKKLLLSGGFDTSRPTRLHSTTGLNLNKNAAGCNLRRKTKWWNELSLSNRRVYRRSIEDKSTDADVKDGVVRAFVSHNGKYNIPCPNCKQS